MLLHPTIAAPIAFWDLTDRTVTGTAGVETDLSTLTIPANCVGPNSVLMMTVYFSFTSSANNKTFKITDGGGSNIFLNVSTTTNLSLLTTKVVFCANSMTSQHFHPVSSSAGLGTLNNAIATSTVDFTTAATLKTTGTLADAADSITCKAFLIEIYNRSIS